MVGGGVVGKDMEGEVGGRVGGEEVGEDDGVREVDDGGVEVRGEEKGVLVGGGKVGVGGGVGVIVWVWLGDVSC